MAITSQTFDFTSRDFESWREELITKARNAFPGWTDFNTANIGVLFLELFAHTLDVLSYTQDQQLRETRITQAVLRKSIIDIGKHFNYTLPGPNPATVDLEITIANGVARANDITIPAGTIVKTEDPEDPIEYRTLSDATIASGNVQVTNVTAENSNEHTESYTADGSKNQSFTLSFSPYIDDSASVTVNLVDTYTEVNNFYNSGPNDKHFKVEVNEDDIATIIWGNGTQGFAPNGPVSITYKTGGGEAGNVDANKITKFDNSSFTDDGGDEVNLSVRNPLGASGGLDRMTIEEARLAIPRSIVGNNRTVTKDDFENHALEVRGVARSMLLTNDQNTSIDPDEGELYIIPIGGGLPTSALKTEVEDFINDEKPPLLNFSFTMEDPSLRIISISAEVFLKEGVTESEARTAIENALEDYFRISNSDNTPNEKIDFGAKLKERAPVVQALGEIPFSDLFDAVVDAEDSAGNKVLRKVEEDSFTPADDVDILDTEFPILGSITLTNGDTSVTF